MIDSPSSQPETTSARYDEFLTHFARDRERLFAYVFSLLPHSADAEDVFQRCSMLLWKKFDQFDRDRSFLSWACGVAFYEVRNFLRSASRDRLQFDDELMDQIAQRREANLAHTDRRLDALQSCLQALGATDRELMRAAYEQGASLAEYAEATGKAVQTVYNRVSLLRRQLLECVQRKLAVGGNSA